MWKSASASGSPCSSAAVASTTGTAMLAVPSSRSTVRVSLRAKLGRSCVPDSSTRMLRSSASLNGLRSGKVSELVSRTGLGAGATANGTRLSASSSRRRRAVRRPSAPSATNPPAPADQLARTRSPAASRAATDRYPPQPEQAWQQAPASVCCTATGSATAGAGAATGGSAAGGCAAGGSTGGAVTAGAAALCSRASSALRTSIRRRDSASSDSSEATRSRSTWASADELPQCRDLREEPGAGADRPRRQARPRPLRHGTSWLPDVAPQPLPHADPRQPPRRCRARRSTVPARRRLMLPSKAFLVVAIDRVHGALGFAGAVLSPRRWQTVSHHHARRTHPNPCPRCSPLPLGRKKGAGLAGAEPPDARWAHCARQYPPRGAAIGRRRRRCAAGANAGGSNSTVYSRRLRPLAHVASTSSVAIGSDIGTLEVKRMTLRPSARRTGRT